MKKKTLWAFALILWFLLFSTFFSLWVEEEMVPWVSTAQSKTQFSSLEGTLPLDCLTIDEDGLPVLYQTYEGVGWEEGTRASLVDPANYEIGEEDMRVEFLSGPAIRYYSKQPRVGELVRTLPKAESGPDDFLVLCRDGLPALKEDVPKEYSVAEQSETTLLVSCEKASFPFLPQKTVSSLFDPDPFSGRRIKAYSLTELRQFSGNLLLLALVLGLALMTTILWAFSLPLLKNAKRNKKPLLLNGGLALCALAAVFLIFRWAALPSSLLPPNSIVELGHYTQEFSEIFSVLGPLAEGGSAIARQALDHAVSRLWLSLGIVLAGILLAVAVALAERRFRRAAKAETPPRRPSGGRSSGSRASVSRPSGDRSVDRRPAGKYVPKH